MSVNQKVLDAIELLAKNSVQRAGYDKTIQAQILSCEDQTIGKYRCKYQDSVFYAYTANPDISLSKGAYVYILVPGNDMSKEKTIIGTTQKLGVNYVSMAIGDQAYHIIGNNTVESNDTYYLDTNNIQYSYDIYNVNNEPSNNDLKLDIQGLNQYLKQSSSLIVGAKFRTQIPTERRSNGHYGIAFNLQFEDDYGTIVKSYVINEDNMVDNPYNLLYNTRQYAIYDIDGEHFKRVQSVTIFNSNFPTANGNVTTGRLNNGDIIISSLELKGAVRMTEEELNGISISFLTPQGTFFMQTQSAISSRQITAQVRVKGKIVSSVQDIDFYWGTEDVSILSNSSEYNKNLGRGWKCLNPYNLISAATETDPAIVEWVPMGDTYTITKEKATAYDNRIKVAAIYDGNVITKEINIQNLSVDADFIKITSTLGTKFYYGVGTTTLQCVVDNEGGLYNDLNYSWAWENNGGVLEPIVGTSDFIEDINENILTNLQVRKIDNFGIFKCSVYNGNIYLGTGSITLTNSMQGEGANPLVIHNGTALYKYSTTGVSPTNASLQKPQLIQALTFSLYDDAGNQIITSDNFINEGLINFPATLRWAVPKINTLLNMSNSSLTPSSSDEEYNYYDNIPTLSYDIVPRYDISKTNNQISLSITYEGATSVAQTNFTFTKEGNIGTNGTEFLIKIVPNTRMANPPQLPMVTKLANSGYQLNYGLNSASETTSNFNPSSPQRLLTVQVWRSDELVYETGGSNNLITPTAIQWSILKNHYWGSGTSSVDDDSDFTIDATTGQMTYTDSLTPPSSMFATSAKADVIKCAVTYENKIYYGAIPFVTAYVNNTNSRIKLKENTGFYYVMYGADGLSPQYSNVYPFEFVNENNETLQPTSAVAVGCVRYKDNNQSYLSPSGDLIKGDGLQFTPISKYSGECVNNGVRCVFTTGTINIPVYFFLNRFGLANINQWDGNSVQINDEDGYILAPQVGAGEKDSNNRFTGVLMGQVKDPSKNQTQEGLFGYGKGVRTFFLNSENGSAIFGKAGNGQIIIDPAQDKALLYSSNYWRNYSQNGLPSNYSSSNENGQGMLIDLSTPQIKWGNGNFSVNSSGDLIATSATITGDITADSGHIGGDNGWTIGSDNYDGWFYSGNKRSLASTNKGAYFGTDGISMYSANGQKTFEIDLTNGTAYFDGSSITLSKDTEIIWGNRTPTVEDLISDIVDGNSPSYITGTFINGTTIESPTIYAGKYYATGQGANDGAAYYIYDGHPNSSSSEEIGYISYDTNGSGSWQTRNRVLFTTLNNTALKLQSAADMSFETNVGQYWTSNGGTIYMMSTSHFARNIVLEQLTYNFDTYHYIGSYGYYDSSATNNGLPPYAGQDGQGSGPDIGQIFFLID